MSGPSVSCKRAGAMELQVSCSDGGSFYVSLMVRQRRTGRSRVVACAYGVLRREITLVKVDGYEDWSLEAGDANFTLSESEAHRISAEFPGIAVRMLPAPKP